MISLFGILNIENLINQITYAFYSINFLRPSDIEYFFTTKFFLFLHEKIHVLH